MLLNRTLAFTFNKSPRTKKIKAKDYSPGPAAYYPSNYIYKNPKSFK
jgi:hypothetical protein